jgi:hypothetical protein
MESININSRQLQFLHKIEELIPPNCSLVNELSDLLEISMDSAYRRIRGETALNFDELIRLCNHFKISFDSYSNVDTDNVTFSFIDLKGDIGSFEELLRMMVVNLKMLQGAALKQIIYACEDIPVFHNYKYPEVSSFKMFYWLHSILDNPELAGHLYNPALIPETLKDLGRQIMELYINVPSIEIWTEATIQSTVKQIEFYWDSGMFETAEDALTICNELKTQIAEIQKQAEIGRKILRMDKPDIIGNTYAVYLSEIEIANNCALIKMGNLKTVHLSHFTLNFMLTSNASYCDKTEQWLNNIIKKSTLISGVSEKLRYQFFNKMFKIIDSLISKINAL